MNEQMRKNIENYASEIITIEEFVAAVRQNPGQFIGYLGNKGFINMIREIFQNATDEMGKADSPCDHVSLFYDEVTHKVTVIDNGRGIPYDNIIRVFTSEHTSSNYVKKAGEFSSGLHGVGSKVTNALSSLFVVESYILGQGRAVEFYDGKPWDKGELEIENDSNMQGTIVTFIPSAEIMGNITTTWQDVWHLVELLMPLTHIGDTAIFVANDRNGNRIERQYVNEQGILYHLHVSNPVIAPICISDVSDSMKADIAFNYDSDNLGTEQIMSFSNLCPTIAGTHVDGFMKAVTKFFKDYMNKIFLANSKKKTKVTDADIKTGLNAVISVAHIKPIFNGQAKEILANDDMIDYISNIVLEALDQWSKANPTDLQKVCRYLKDVAELRLKSDEGKVKLSSSYKANSLSGKPKKYLPPNGKKELEFIIVEGDSAMGSYRNDRDAKRQGIFPIRGKIKDAFNTPKKTFLQNEEVASILSIFGCGYGKDFDISKFPFDKVIIATDADADGAHIRALLFRFFILYCAPIITSGKLYACQPPLFGMSLGNGKGFRYFAGNIDFIKYCQKIFASKNDISDEHGKPIKPLDMTGIFMRNVEYLDELENMADMQAVDPDVLEIALRFRNDMKLLKKAFKGDRKYRFTQVDNRDGIVSVTGLAGSNTQSLFLTPVVLTKCSRLIRMLDSSPFYYILNGNRITLGQLMRAFKKSQPDVKRYKGLGEMDGDQLAESTLYPDSGRTLMRYNLESVKATIEEIRALESNRYLLLQNTENLTRSEID